MAIAKTSVEQIFNDFIVKSGGRLVSSLVGGSSPPPNADYYFSQEEIIGELKCLQVNSFGSNYQIKLQKLFDEWMERRLFVVYGTRQVDIRDLQPERQREWMRLIEAPLQKNILGQADRQIKETKMLLNSPNSRGVLFLSSDGNSSMQPHTLMCFIDRILRKKKEDGSRQYSNIDAVVYFSLSMPGRHPNIPLPIQFWTGFGRDLEDLRIREFVDKLEVLWFEFQRSVLGLRIFRATEKSILLPDIKIS